MVVVSDTSVLIDLRRGELLTSAFRLPWGFVVPDLLYERELKPLGAADELQNLGLRVEALDGAGVAVAIGYQRRRRELSLPDSFALALAKTNAWRLLTGDRALRELAAGELVDCHGVLWLLDRMLEEGTVNRHALREGLQTISTHPRCRLPRAEVRKRLVAWEA